MLEPSYIKYIHKQFPADVLQNTCTGKFWRIHKKTPVLESLFNKAPALDRLQQKCLSMNFVKFSRTPFLQSTLSDCFWTFLTKLLLLLSLWSVGWPLAL